MSIVSAELKEQPRLVGRRVRKRAPPITPCTCIRPSPRLPRMVQLNAFNARFGVEVAATRMAARFMRLCAKRASPAGSLTFPRNPADKVHHFPRRLSDPGWSTGRVSVGRVESVTRHRLRWACERGPSRVPDVRSRSLAPSPRHDRGRSPRVLRLRSLRLSSGC